MAVKFYLPDGGKTDIVGLTLPCFFVRTPEDFLSFTKARKEPEQLMPDWLGAHPEALPAIQAALSADPPLSYATCAYNSIHSYRWIDSGGGSRFVRYRFEPEAGEHTLPPEEAKARGRDYLQEDLLARDRLPPERDPGHRGGRGGRPDRRLARAARAGRGGAAGPRRTGAGA
jgi:catalase